MGGVFSSSGQPKKNRSKAAGSVSDVDRAMLDLKNARDRLSRYRTKLERDEAKLLEGAKQAKEAGQTQRALGLLRLRRYKQTELESVEAQLLTVLQMVQTIDSKQNEQELLAALKSGKDALQKMHQETTVDDVLELMDQVQEEIQVEAEINAILQDVPSLSKEDEDAVEAELQALQESLQEPLELPDVPKNKLVDEKQPAKDEAPEKVAQSSGRVAVPS